MSYIVNGHFFAQCPSFCPVLRGRRLTPYPSGVTESTWPWVFMLIIREALNPTKGCPREDLGEEETPFSFWTLLSWTWALKSLVMLEGTARLRKDSLCCMGVMCVSDPYLRLPGSLTFEKEREAG